MHKDLKKEQNNALRQFASIIIPLIFMLLVVLGILDALGLIDILFI